MTEQLTKEERTYVTHHALKSGQKAVRLIDELNLELEERRKIDLDNCKKIDTQFAVIERVRAELEFPWISTQGLRGAIERALSAAPEQTAQLKVERDALVEAVERRDQGISDLRGLLAAANARIAELESTVAAHERHGRCAEAEVSAANARIAELERDNANAWHLRDEAEQRVNTANARIAELEAMLRQAEDDCGSALTRADAAETDRRRLAGAVDDALESKQRAESEAAALRGELKTALEWNDALRAELRELSDAVAARTSEAAALRAEFDKANARADAAERKAESWERGHDYAWSEKQRAESEAAREKARADAAERAHEQALNERDLAHQQIEFDNAQGLFQQNERLRQVNKELLTTRAAAESEAAALRAEVLNLQGLLDAQAAVISDERARADAAERAKAEWERLRGEAYSLYRSEAEKRERAESEAAALRAELTELRSRAEALDESLAHAQHARDEARAEVERLRGDLQEQSAERNEAESRECTLKGNLAAENVLLGRVREELRVCEAEVEQRDPEDRSFIQADGYRHIRAILSGQAPARTDQEVAIPAPSQCVVGRFCTDHERAVLEAMRGAGQSALLSYQQTPGWLGNVCRAELARREAKS